MDDFIADLERAVAPGRQRLLSGAFFQQLHDGSLTRAHYAGFLEQAFHYTKHTPRLLAAAIARLGPEHEGLADRFLANAREETGHHKWALMDLHALGVDVEAVIAADPLPATEALVAYSYYVINYVDPVGLLGTNYALETLGGKNASMVAARLRQVLGIDERAMTFLLGHGEADIEHVARLKEVTARYATTAPVRRLVIRTACAIYELYATMMAAINEAVAKL